jgi:hypothetical protein
VSNDVTLGWKPENDGDRILNFLRDVIQKQFHGDVVAALSGTPVKRSADPTSVDDAERRIHKARQAILEANRELAYAQDAYVKAKQRAGESDGGSEVSA